MLDVREIDKRMGRLPTGNRQYQIQYLWDRHQEILRRSVIGQSAKDIASALHITPTVVSYTLNSEIARQSLAVLRGARDASSVDISKRIKEFAPKALDLLEKVIDGGLEEDKPSNAAVRVAMDNLDRAGYGAPKKIVGAFAHKVFTNEDVEEIKNRALEVGKQQGIVEDAVAEEIIEDG